MSLSLKNIFNHTFVHGDLQDYVKFMGVNMNNKIITRA